MPDFYATGSIWVGNVDTDEEAAEIASLIEDALSGAGYQATVNVEAHVNAPLPDGELR